MRPIPTNSGHTKPTAGYDANPTTIRLPRVDWAVCISLRRRPERWQAFESRAKYAGLGFVKRFNAIDGNELDLPDTLKSHSGAYGCLYSHAAVYEEAIKMGASNILILEDDAVFSSEIATITEYAAATIGAFSWIHLGGTHPFYRKHAIVYPTHLQVAKTLSTHGYIADRALMVSYLNWLAETPLPRSGLLHSDRLLLHLCKRHSFKICIPHHPLVWQDKSLPSDVQWGAPNPIETK